MIERSDRDGVGDLFLHRVNDFWSEGEGLGPGGMRVYLSACVRAFIPRCVHVTFMGEWRMEECVLSEGKHLESSSGGNRRILFVRNAEEWWVGEGEEDGMQIVYSKFVP